MTREEAIRHIKDIICENNAIKPNITVFEQEKEALYMAIEVLEQESKTGHWIYTLEDWNKWECSECGFTKRTDVHVNIGYKYCPNCGTRMKNAGSASKIS